MAKKPKSDDITTTLDDLIASNLKLVKQVGKLHKENRLLNERIEQLEKHFVKGD